MRPKTAIIRDDRFLEHLPGHSHPEHPRRLRSIHRMLDKSFPDTFLKIEPEPAPMEILERVHTPSYINKVLKTAAHKFTNLAPDTPAGAKTYISAWLAVGGCLSGLKALIEGQCDICFALVRPPGHHALRDRAGGFCIFNNLGITARYAIQALGFKRILIIDWDVHHGNGIQDLFYRENKVLYFSSHDMLLYPYSGDWEEIGYGKGSGFTINIPFSRDLADDDVLHVYREILTRVFQRYMPELVLVVAGFDAHQDDPIGRCKLSASAFAGLTRLILDLRLLNNRPPVLLALEGGYDGKALANSIQNVLSILAGKSPEVSLPIIETDKGTGILKKAYQIHAPLGVWVD